jgi:FtsP/CotA-like multicopper oxidase with cupredoxin domain
MPIPIDLLLRLHFLVGRLRLDPPALKRFQSYPSIELNDDFKEPSRFRDTGLFSLFKHHPIGRTDYQELVTVNGTVAPTLPIRPGEAQFWEMGHIGADRFLRVKVEGMPFYVIGRDGYFVPRPIRMDEVLSSVDLISPSKSVLGHNDISHSRER